MTATVLVRRLEQFRRRESALRAVGVGLHAACAAIVIAAIASTRFDPQLTAITCAAGAAALTIAAATLWRRPLDRVAAAIDQHAGLSDRIVTAYEHRNATDAVGRLLIEDANRHAASIAPSNVFPFRMPSRIAWTIAVSAVAIVASTMTLPITREQVIPDNNASADDAGAVDEQGKSNASGSTREGRKSASNRSAAIASALPPGVTPSVRTAVGEQAKAADAASGAPAGAATPLPPQPVAGDAHSDAGSRLGAKAAGAGATATASSTAAGALSSGPARTTATEPAARPGAATPRDVTLAAGSTSGQRALPPGMRAYVRSYFDAIKK